MKFCKEQIACRSRLAILLVGTLLLLVGCNSRSPRTPTPQSAGKATVTAEESVDANVVNEFVQRLPNWQAPDSTELPPTLLEANEEFSDDSYQRCETVEYDRKRNFDNLIAVGANATALKPGMLVQGRGVRDGALSVIGLARSPFAISINLALESPTRRVEEPSSATIQEAIASLQREADTRLGNLDVIPAQISFQVKEAYSFEQAMLDAGISLKYSGVLANGDVGTALRRSSNRESHTVIVKLFQPMYTISFADDALAEPRDFFAATVTQADFERQIELGTMGPNNEPTYVQSVTYGRMLVYSVTSTEAASAEALRVAVQASYGAFSGSAQFNQGQAALVRNSTIEAQVFGGTQETSTAALKEALQKGDYGAFLQATPATAAIPLSYRINDLKNRTAAVIGDATKYTIQSCKAYSDMRFTVTLDRIAIAKGGENEQDFDIEAEVTTGDNYYWLLHNAGQRFTREDLANIGETAIFELAVTPGSYLDFYVADFGNSATGRQGWTRTKRFEFPFQFESNPYSFSIFDTTTDSSYRNSTMEIYFTVQRELIAGQ